MRLAERGKTFWQKRQVYRSLLLPPIKLLLISALLLGVSPMFLWFLLVSRFCNFPLCCFWRCAAFGVLAAGLVPPEKSGNRCDCCALEKGRWSMLKKALDENGFIRGVSSENEPMEWFCSCCWINCWWEEGDEGDRLSFFNPSGFRHPKWVIFVGLLIRIDFDW